MDSPLVVICKNQFDSTADSIWLCCMQYRPTVCSSSFPRKSNPQYCVWFRRNKTEDEACVRVVYQWDEIQGIFLNSWQRKHFLSVLAATLIMSVHAAGEPDCAALANENPLKISRYYHPHASDCNQYYQCSRYALVPMVCPEGLHFDRNLYICGRPHEVTCWFFCCVTEKYWRINLISGKVKCFHDRMVI